MPSTNTFSRTFGVEFEFFIPIKKATLFVEDYKTLWLKFHKCSHIGPITRAKLAKFISWYLLEHLELKNWKVKDDGSIEDNISGAHCIFPGSHYPHSFEIITPVLEGKEDLKKIKKFLKFIGPYGHTNDTCGTHVHIGLQKDVPESHFLRKTLISLIQYSSLEPVFDTLVKDNRRDDDNEYCGAILTNASLLNNYVRDITFYNPEFMTRPAERNKAKTIRAPFMQSHDRYQKLNVVSLQRHKTIEFRHLHGTLDYDTVSKWITLCQSFIHDIFSTKKYDKLCDELKKTETKYINTVYRNSFTMDSSFYRELKTLSDNFINKKPIERLCKALEAKVA